MKLILKWLIYQLAGSLIMAIIVSYFIIGKVKGFYDPGLGMVLMFLIIYFFISLFFGAPLIFFIFFRTEKNTKNLLINNMMFIFITIVMISFSVYFFSLNILELLSMLLSYFPGYILIYMRKMKSVRIR